MAVFFISKSLNRVEKLYGREQCRAEGYTVHVICCVIFVLLGDSK